MRRLIFAFWNVTNLFESGAVPRGPQSDAELAARIARLADVLNSLDEGRGPHLLALAEIATQNLIEQLRHRLGSDYLLLWEPAPRRDLTGLGVLLRTDEFADLRRIDAERPLSMSRPRNLLARCDLIGEHEPVIVAVCHWRSRMQYGIGVSASASDPTGDRMDSARWLARKLGDLGRNPCVVVLGDFNAEPYEAPFGDAGLGAHSHFSTALQGTSTTVPLYNIAWRHLPEPDYWEDLVAAEMSVSRPRTSHDCSPPAMFDQILVSGAVLRKGPIRLVEKTVRLLAIDGVNSVRRASGGLFPLRWEYNANSESIGCADHYPLVAEFLVA